MRGNLHRHILKHRLAEALGQLLNRGGDEAVKLHIGNFVRHDPVSLQESAPPPSAGTAADYGWSTILDDAHNDAFSPLNPEFAAMPRFSPLATACLLAFLASGCSLPSLLITPVSSSPELEETIADPGTTRREKIAIIEVEGMLANTRAGSGGLLGGGEENKVSLFRQQLDAAAADKRVKAVVLRINSPGGTVTASDAMYDMLIDFKARTGKPVIAACQDLAASGGYYIAVGADEIHAAPTSLVGSIGVIFQTIDISELMEKVGVKTVPLTSGPMKDMGSPFDGLDEQERAVMQGMVDELYGRFVTTVKRHRTISDEATVFDGRVFTGVAAQQAGLVDRVCGLEESIARARQMADAPGASVILYRRPYGYRGSIYASAGDIAPRADASDTLRIDVPGLERLASMLQPGAYYLWMP